MGQFLQKFCPWKFPAIWYNNHILHIQWNLYNPAPIGEWKTALDYRGQFVWYMYVCMDTTMHHICKYACTVLYTCKNINMPYNISGEYTAYQCPAVSRGRPTHPACLTSLLWIAVTITIKRTELAKYRDYLDCRSHVGYLVPCSQTHACRDWRHSPKMAAQGWVRLNIDLSYTRLRDYRVPLLQLQLTSERTWYPTEQSRPMSIKGKI
jgi:hypothetical protein